MGWVSAIGRQVAKTVQDTPVAEAVVKSVQDNAGATALGAGAGALLPAETTEERLANMAALAGGAITAKNLVRSPAQASEAERYLEGPGTEVMGVFGGISARNAPLPKLERAKAMEAAGADPKMVWKETGWLRGEEGAWKFEIDDSKAMMLVDAPKLAWEFDLADMFDHPELFDAYPELKQAQIMFKDMGPVQRDQTGQIVRGATGAYDPMFRTVIVNNRLSREEAAEVALHEIQHAVQQTEGFARGGMPEPGKEYMDTPQIEAAFVRLGDLKLKHDRATDPMQKQMIKAQMDTLSTKITEQAQLEYYKRLPGEVEARLVERRRKMSEAERAGTFPKEQYDVAPTASQGGGAASSVRFETPGSPEYEAAIAKGLDMSTPARMARAKEMGFDTETVLYHGTNADFDAFTVQNAGDRHGGGTFKVIEGDKYAEDVMWPQDKQASRDLITAAGRNPDDPDWHGGGLVAAEIRKTWHRMLSGQIDPPTPALQKAVDKAPKLQFSEPAVFMTADPNIASRYATARGAQSAQKVLPLMVRGKIKEVVINAGYSSRIGDELTKAKAEGFDGVKLIGVRDKGGVNDQIAIFDPSNIRSVNAAFDPDNAQSANLLASQRGGPLDDEPLPSGRPQPAPMFYSALGRFVSSNKTAKAPAAQWKGMIQNAPGIKAEEVEWTGVMEWLDLQEGPVTREAVAQFVEANGVRVEEVVRGGGSFDEDLQRQLLPLIEERDRLTDSMDPTNQASIDAVLPRYRELGEQIDNLRATINAGVGDVMNETKWSSWTLSGGENYREMLLTLPVQEGEATRKWRAEIDRLKAKYGDNFYNSGKMTPEEKRNLETLHRAAGHGVDKSVNYTSSHWSEPNVLAHVRFKEREAPTYTTALLADIERRIVAEFGTGYASGAPAGAVRKGLITPLEAAQFSHAKGYAGVDKTGATQRVLALEEIQSDWGQIGREQGFIDPQEIAAAIAAGESAAADRALAFEDMKAALLRDDVRQLVNTGGTQREKDTIELIAANDLSRNPMSIDLIRNAVSAHMRNPRLSEDSRTALQSGYDAYRKATEAFDNAQRARSQSSRGVPDAPFVKNTSSWTELVLKRMIRYAVENGFDAVAWIPGNIQNGRVVDTDDNRGDFYDKIVPNAANKLGKKYGARVEKKTFDIPEFAFGLGLHTFPITPELRDVAVNEGFAMFSKRGGPLDDMDFTDAMTGQQRPATPSGLAGARPDAPSEALWVRDRSGNGDIATFGSNGPILSVDIDGKVNFSIAGRTQTKGEPDVKAVVGALNKVMPALRQHANSPRALDAYVFSSASAEHTNVYRRLLAKGAAGDIPAYEMASGDFVLSRLPLEDLKRRFGRTMRLITSEDARPLNLSKKDRIEPLRRSQIDFIGDSGRAAMRNIAEAGLYAGAAAGAAGAAGIALGWDGIRRTEPEKPPEDMTPAEFERWKAQEIAVMEAEKAAAGQQREPAPITYNPLPMTPEAEQNMARTEEAWAIKERRRRGLE